jgi:hypothetical protein
MRNAYFFFAGNSEAVKRRDNLGDLDRDGRMISKRVSECVRWIKFI